MGRQPNLNSGYPQLCGTGEHEEPRHTDQTLHPAAGLPLCQFAKPLITETAKWGCLDGCQQRLCTTLCRALTELEPPNSGGIVVTDLVSPFSLLSRDDKMRRSLGYALVQVGCHDLLQLASVTMLSSRHIVEPPGPPSQSQVLAHDQCNARSSKLERTSE